MKDIAKLVIAVAIGFSGLAVGPDSARADCKYGTKHCVNGAGIKTPKPCGGAAHPCTIDGGLGSQCKGAGANCGLAGQTLPPNPTGRATPSMGGRVANGTLTGASMRR